MKQINQKAPVICKRSVTIGAPREKVWERLSNINEWPHWQTDISKSEIKGPAVSGSEFTWKSGGANIRSVLHTATPSKYFGWTGSSMGVFAIHNWVLSEKDGHTKVMVEESMEGWLAIVFSGFFNKSLETGMERWLKYLKVKCESPI